MTNANSAVQHAANKWGLESVLHQRLYVSDASLGPVAPAIDFLSPEALIDYFGAKIRNVRGDIQTLMARQDERARRSNQLQAAEGTLQQWVEKDVRPGDPNWDQFVAAANQLKELLGDSAEGQKVAALIDRALAPTPNTREMGLESARELQAQNPDAQVSYDIAQGKATVTTNDGPPAGLSKSEVSSVIAQSKSMRDQLNSDNSMDMIRLQDAIQKVSRIENAASNLTKTIDDAKKNTIANFR